MLSVPAPPVKVVTLVKSALFTVSVLPPALNAMTSTAVSAVAARVTAPATPSVRVSVPAPPVRFAMAARLVVLTVTLTPALASATVSMLVRVLPMSEVSSSKVRVSAPAPPVTLVTLVRSALLTDTLSPLAL